MAEYKAKPPLWQPTPTKHAKLTAAAVAVGTTALILTLLLVYEKDFLSTPAGQAEVVVVGVQGDKPQGKLPAWFKYIVVLPDGTRGIFVSDRIQQSGERLLATVSRGRVTGRMWLGAPYRVLTDPVGPSVRP